MISYENLKNILFKFDPETAHNIASIALRAISYSDILHSYLVDRYFVDEEILHQYHFKRLFRNPVGLAAGFDKNGDFIKGISALGFGYTEVGTVTPRAQKGNAKPRLFRLVDEESLQNQMGFNNKGAYHLIQKLKKLRFFDYPIGINIGKNKTTPNSEALNDYETLFKAFKKYGDYIVVNISSPNTPNLRDLQNEAFIKELLNRAKKITSKDILIKISPDISIDNALKLVESAIEAGASGIIATNTTIDYSLSQNAREQGGISGKLLKEKSFKLFKELSKEFFNKTLLISVGGIDSPKEAYNRILYGASLIQIYTAFIYKGPHLIYQINRELIKMLKSDGFKSINEAIGAKL
ncbi:MAG: quinone-dependent dihydroorotate dehydrogenase [Epsilonproteobacteria bacterium]|nr:quinone-dependent dihydroorotate dehydrogenase [Campylobacterota bacterium]